MLTVDVVFPTPPLQDMTDIVLHMRVPSELLFVFALNLRIEPDTMVVDIGNVLFIDCENPLLMRFPG